MTLPKLKDGSRFRLTPKGVIYQLNTIQKKHAVFTSESSGRTYTRLLKTKVYEAENCGKKC